MHKYTTNRSRLLLMAELLPYGGVVYLLHDTLVDHARALGQRGHTPRLADVEHLALAVATGGHHTLAALDKRHVVDGGRVADERDRARAVLGRPDLQTHVHAAAENHNSRWEELAHVHVVHVAAENSLGETSTKQCAKFSDLVSTFSGLSLLSFVRSR